MSATLRVFLYREVLHKEIEPILLGSAKHPERLPTVLTREEAINVINQLNGTHKLMAQLLYGSGLRLMECSRLRVKDIDFEYKTITIRDGKACPELVEGHVLQRGGLAVKSPLDS